MNSSKRKLFSLILLGVLGIPVSAQDIDTVYKNTPIEQVFSDLREKTNHEFVYQKQILQGVKPVTCTLKDKRLEEVLNEVLKGTGLTYEIVDNTVIIRKAETNRKTQQTHRIYGTVISKDDGLPIIGASVRLLGADNEETTFGTATDIDGRFEITGFTFGANYKVQISYIGMKTQVLAANADMHVVLESDAQKLQDVVVTGIFKKAKESYTGAVSTVTSEELDMFKGQNLLQTLKNIDASLNFAVNNIAGSNPNALPQINIRGNSSLPMSVQEFNESASNAVNTPLIIMDGFEISLEKLMDYNDEEIESINILKDAAATAIYGSRGSNGVIVVVTKQPEPGKLRVNAEVGLDFEVPDISSYDLLNAREKLELENSLGLYNDTGNTDLDVEYQKLYNQRLRRVLAGQTTDWISKPIRTGVGSHYNMRLEGGSEEFRWSATANYKDVEGAMKNSSRRTFNGSITLMYTVKNFTFKNYTSYGMSRSTESNYGSFSDYVAQQPYNSPYDENGELVEYFENFHGSSRGRGEFNPLYDAALGSFDKSGYEELTNNFAVEWNILPELTLRGQFGITSTTDHSDVFLSPENSYFTSDSDTADEFATDEGFFRRGSYTYGTGKSYNYSGNVTLSYSKTFQDKHQLYVGLDYSMNQSDGYNYMFEVEGISDDQMSFLGNARQYAQNGIPTGTKLLTRMMGFTGNVNYTYDGRCYVDMSYRVDGSSTFGTDKKYAPFWSAGIGWNLHNEKFLAGNPTLNILRLKASYGQTGSQQGSGSGAATIFAYQTNNKYMNWTGASLQELGNPRLTWQTTDEFNVGLEFGLWQGRIKGEFDFYTKTTSNLLSEMDIPQSMGFSSYMANVGEVKNRGFEASLSAYIIRDHNREFNWLVTGQLVYDKNWISKLSDAIKKQNELYLNQLETEDGDRIEISNLFYEGNPQNGIYAVRSLGIDPSTGREIYLDRNGNKTHTWAAGDKVFLGSSDPLYRGNFGTMLMWKGFTFNMSFNYYWGGKTYNQTLVDRVEVTTNTLMTSNVDRRVLTDRWMQPGDVTFFKGFNNDATQATSRFVMDDNVLELSSVSLQYRWDSDWIRKYARVQSITFGVNMSDLFHWGSIKMERGTSYPYARNIQGSIKFLF